MEINIISNDNMAVNGDVLTITDANNKKFNVSVSDIVDVSKFQSSDLSQIGDSERQRLLNFKPTITDSEGVEITDSNLLSSVKGGEAEALDVTFEATHSGLNLNHSIYTSKGLEEDTQSWLYPFQKPLIKNHDLYQEPIGRTQDAYFGASEFANDRDTINVTYRVSDEDAMVKFADGRYKTMSIGASSGYIRCNICGKDILKDNQLKFCGHWKGNTYAGKKATWTVEKMTFKEGSIVNNPADVYAQVKSIKVVKKEGAKVSNQNTTNNDDNKDDDDILNQIDGVLGGEGTDPTKIADNEPEGNDPKQGDTEPPNVNTDNSDNDGNVDLQTQLDEANTRIANLEGEVQTLTKDKETLNTKLDEATADASIVATDNEALKLEVADVKEQAKRMAKFNLKLMKDNLKDLNPDISDAELEGKKAKEINDMISNLRESQTRNTSSAQTVTNPGIVGDDANSISDDGNENNKPKKVIKTMKDMEDDVLNMWSNH